MAALLQLAHITDEIDFLSSSQVPSRHSKSLLLINETSIEVDRRELAACRKLEAQKSSLQKKITYIEGVQAARPADASKSPCQNNCDYSQAVQEAKEQEALARTSYEATVKKLEADLLQAATSLEQAALEKTKAASGNSFEKLQKAKAAVQDKFKARPTCFTEHGRLQNFELFKELTECVAARQNLHLVSDLYSGLNAFEHTAAFFVHTAWDDLKNLAQNIDNLLVKFIHDFITIKSIVLSGKIAVAQSGGDLEFTVAVAGTFRGTNFYYELDFSLHDHHGFIHTLFTKYAHTPIATRSPVYSFPSQALRIRVPGFQ